VGQAETATIEMDGAPGTLPTSEPALPPARSLRGRPGAPHQWDRARPGGRCPLRGYYDPRAHPQMARTGSVYARIRTVCVASATA